MRKITTKYVKEMKQHGKKITMLTAYDYLTAQILDHVGIDIILVGDSLGMVFLGADTTQYVTLRQVAYHTRAVASATQKAMVVGDLPHMTYETPVDALKNARWLIDAGADVVKLEGDKPEVVKRLVKEGIQVMGHIGLTPQTMTKFKVQGKDHESQKRLLKEAKSLEEAGCFALVLECVSRELAKEITNSVSIPTIGIGAGVDCDGQVLVFHDLVGLFDKFKPKFVKRYAHLNDTIKEAVAQFRKDVEDGTFPDEEHSYK